MQNIRDEHGGESCLAPGGSARNTPPARCGVRPEAAGKVILFRESADVRTDRPRASHFAGTTSLPAKAAPSASAPDIESRSEEHTSELQSHSDLVCRLLLE